MVLPVHTLYPVQLGRLKSSSYTQFIISIPIFFHKILYFAQATKVVYNLFIMKTNDFLEAVCRRRNVLIDDVLSRKRSKRLVGARSEIAKILRQNLGLSYPEIGAILHRDHTSIIHLVKKVNADVGPEIPLPMFPERAKPQSIDPEKGFHLVSTAGDYHKWSRLMHERNGLCEIPECNFGDVLEVHHLVSRKMHGTDSRDNVIVLCPNHHRMLHHGLLKLKPEAFPHLVIPRGLWITDLVAPVSGD